MQTLLWGADNAMLASVFLPTERLWSNGAASSPAVRNNAAHKQRD